MAMFSYEARNSLGELVGGMINAESLRKAGDELCKKNLYVVKIAPADSKSHSSSDNPTKARGKKNKSQDVMWFIAQLSIMIETGIPLSDALECLSRQSSSDGMKSVLNDLSRGVSEGKSLSDAMSLHSRTFPTTMVALIRASEMSGTLSAVLKRISDYLVKDHQITRRMKSALIYPAFMFMLCVGITIFLLTFILPKFANIFASRGAALPAPTQFLMSTSDLLINHWLMLLVGLIALVLGIRFWAKSSMGRIQCDRFELTIPVISVVFHKLYQSRSFRTMSTLLKSGVPLTDAIDITGEVNDNAFYADLWERVDRAVRDGDSIAAPLKTSPLISESVGYMIESGDRSGQLSLVFERLAAFVEEEYDQAIKTLMQFVEPVIVLVMGSVIGFVAISVLLPLFQSGKVLSQ